ncbi:MAG: TIGR00296 family protein [Thermoplasmata archaeon]|nr:TIGR00296 family protein [Thermoplasmata archaeon]
MVRESEGARAVALAREAIAHHLTDPHPVEPGGRVVLAELPPLFRDRRGVFVTLKKWPGGNLRGCIGFPLPVYPLGVAIARAAVAAAVEDPRFRAVVPSELDRLTVEVSVLTPPEPLPGRGRADRIASVQVGRDGLIVEGGGESGLLLPQVAVEYGWDPERFLRETCRKAGLPPTAWQDPNVEVLRFRAEVFAESRPGGPVAPEPTVTPPTGDEVA